MRIFSQLKVAAKKYTAAFAVLALALPVKVLASGISSGLSDVRGEFSGSTGSLFMGARDIPELIAAIIRILLMIGGAIAVLFVIIGGYQYLTSGGNEEAAEKGRKTVTNALIGVVVVVLSWVIVNVVVNTVG